MKEQLDRILNPIVLLVLNVAIIAAAELTGTYFFYTGIIHVIAVGFIVLAVSRIYLHYYSYDAVLENFFHATLIALFVFASSHFAEFLSYKVFGLSEDATFANVANFYVICLLLLAIGAEIFIGTHDHRTPLVVLAYGVIAGIFGGFIIALFWNDTLVSLDVGSATPYIYALISIVAGVIAFARSLKIGRMVSIARRFVDYLLGAIALIIFSVLPNVFYDVLKDVGLPVHQVIYISHFLFYAALSLMFLAFRTTAGLGGVYAELRNIEANRPPLAK